jgi:hypothetical protein
MRITRNSLDTTPGPGEWFTGAAYIDTVAAPSEPSPLRPPFIQKIVALSERGIRDPANKLPVTR